VQVKLTIQDHDDRQRDVEISASQRVDVDQVAKLLAGSVDALPLFSDGRSLSDSTQLGDSGLRNGSVLTTKAGTCRQGLTGSALFLKVIAGPDCGRVVPLHRGSHVIGRGGESDTTLADPELSRRHLRLLVGMHTVDAEDLGSTNGTMIDGRRLTGPPRRVLPNDLITIGKTRLQVAIAAEPPVVAVPDGDGQLLIFRPPVLQEWPMPTEHSVPDPPVESPRPRMQWLAAVVPAAISVVLAMSLRSTAILAFAALSPFTMLTSGLVDRRSWRRARRDQAAAHLQALQVFRTAVDQSLRAEERMRHHAFADAASTLLAATTRDCRLWERRPGRQAFLTVRIGLADQSSDTMVRSRSVASPAGSVSMVPATVTLTTSTLGISGPRESVDGLCRWLTGQLLVLHSPADLDLVLITDQPHSAGWRWLRWVPAAASTIAVTTQQRQQIAEDLQRMLRERKQRHPRVDWSWSSRWTVVIIDPAILVTELPGIADLIEHGPEIGVTVICIADDHRSLPTGCSAILRFAEEPAADAILTRPSQPDLQVVVDLVDAVWSDRIARSLAWLRDAGDERRADDLVRQVGLTELLGLPAVSAAAVRDRWQAKARPVGAPLGVSRAGAFEIDLVEDGPHLLIAGTTGAGKSELLRSLVTSMAVQQPPDELAFVLIDYKGGAAFAECAELPHVVGLVTDLDPHLTRRALASLNAELRRRECILAAAGVSDLGEYQKESHKAGQPLARLVLVVDEFASLAEELPELLTGLLGIAQRGRSLGVHLVLATQRPAGVLSADIKANVGLRIALRVVDAADSVDVIDVADASRISRAAPGRAIARQAGGQLVEFQTVCVTKPAVSQAPLTLTELDEWNNPIKALPEPGQLTELTQLIQAITAAAEGRRRPDRPWLPPLPDILSLTPQPGSSRVVFGRSDEPALQRQSAIAIDLAEGGSVAFIGGPRSGRSTALRTVLGMAAGQLTADQLHIYVLDCAGATLRPFQQLPHCGAALEATDPAAIGRLIIRLSAEHQLRQHQLADLGVTDYSEGCRAGSRLPAILVALDGWENFSALSDEMDGGRTADLLLHLLREGPSTGFTLLVTGDRNALGARLGSAIGRKLLLPLADRGDYALAGLDRAAVPTRQVPGRAVSTEDGIEMQLGLIAEDVSTSEQWSTLYARASMQPATDQPPTIRFRPLPTTVAAADLLAEADPTVEGTDCLLGLGGDDGSVARCEVFRSRARFLIAGPDGSGKSTAAILIARQAQCRGLRVVIAAVTESPLATWARQRHISVIGPAGTVDGIDPDLLLIEDVEQFEDCPVGQDLQTWIAAAPAAVVATARTSDLLNSFRGLGVEMRRHRCGILLQPSAADGELLGVRLPHLPASTIAGRGVLVSATTRSVIGGYQPVQVAA